MKPEHDTEIVDPTIPGLPSEDLTLSDKRYHSYFEIQDLRDQSTGVHFKIKKRKKVELLKPRQAPHPSEKKHKLVKVTNKDGIVVWEPDIKRFFYRDESTNKMYSCSFFIEGGVVIIKDHLGEVVEAYKLKDGETVETVY